MLLYVPYPDYQPPYHLLVLIRPGRLQADNVNLQGVSMGSRLFPPAIRSSALAFMFVLGQVGGSMFPAVTGAIASRASVEVLQPMLVGLLIATGVSCLLIPRKGAAATATDTEMNS